MALLRLGRQARQPAAALAGSAALVVLVLAAGSAPALAQAGEGMQSVSYEGYHFEIPGTWPVFDLSRQPLTCVRFDLHAVYLGTPGSAQDCPAAALGHTESLLIQAVSPASAQARPVCPGHRRHRPPTDLRCLAVRR